MWPYIYIWRCVFDEGFKATIPVEVHLVYLWVVRLDAFLLLVEEGGEVGERRFHWEHLGKVVDFRANLIQHPLHSYTSI